MIKFGSFQLNQTGVNTLVPKGNLHSIFLKIIQIFLFISVPEKPWERGVLPSHTQDVRKSKYSSGDNQDSRRSMDRTGDPSQEPRRPAYHNGSGTEQHGERSNRKEWDDNKKRNRKYK